MGFIKRLLCIFLGHKESRTIMAYHIDAYPEYLRFKIYTVSLCSKCNCISVHMVDKYDKYSWYAPQLRSTGEDILRKQGLVTLAEAYKELGVNE